MLTVEEVKNSNSIYRIPSYVHVNKGILFDYRLFETLTHTGKRANNDFNYDFDVYLPKYDINLQRPYVWEHSQQNEFIKSILIDKQLEPVVIVQHIDDYKDRNNSISYIIDGKQRLMTIIKFANNEFPVNINGQDYYWKDFSENLQHYFASRVNYMTATVYYSYPDALVDDDMKIILFNYYNFSGTPQTEEHKNKLQSLLKKQDD